MPQWVPTPVWKDLDAYVIGGGDSLHSFPFEILHNQNTIGCNAAYTLGPDICKICIFGDIKWWNKFKGEKGLSDYAQQGILVTGSRLLKNERTPWLWWMPRINSGLGQTELGWNGNTGSLAVNLALILGARRVFLLGFDMKVKRNRANWHDKGLDRPNPSTYIRFIRGYERVRRLLPVIFPGREVFNVTDDSDLNCFPKIPLREHFGAAVAA